jgi:tetratricopeptide (TPR) repeat protein
MIRLICLFAVALVLLVSAPAFAQDFDWADAFRRGNSAYNSERYDEARELYIKAVQADPERPAAYRNLARAYFWLDQYAAAVLHYDHYLRLAPEASDAEKIKSERRLAADRAGESVWTLPESQQLTRTALDKALEDGAAFTEGGGGAWGLYQTLLRTGYAQPDLAQIRMRMARRLVDEYEAVLAVEAGQPTPNLSLADWQVEIARLANARSVADDPALREIIDRRATIAEAALALLSGQSGNAADLARLASTSNPDFVFVKWYEIAALIESDDLEGARNVLEAFSRVLAERDPASLDYARVMRAEILRRQERLTDAAELYWELLQR